MVKSTMTGTVTSSGHGGTVAVMAQNEQMAEEHSMLTAVFIVNSETLA